MKSHPNSRIARLSALVLFLFANHYILAQTAAGLDASRVMLPNGWAITCPGNSLPLGDLPLQVLKSPQGNLVAISNSGQSDQSIQLFDAHLGKQVDSLPVSKTWMGMAFSADEKNLYLSGGNDNWIIHCKIVARKLIPADTIIVGKAWPNPISPAGLCVDDIRRKLYVVTKEDNSLYILNLNDKSVEKRLPLGDAGYQCMLSRDRKYCFVSCWGCDKIMIFDCDKQDWSGSIACGDQPNDFCLSADGHFMWVCNANDNSVSAIDLRKKQVIETLNAALYPNAPNGSTTNGVCLSDDQRSLYVANADNNCLAVFDVSVPGKSKSKGFIPTGWYPTAVQYVGGKLWIANGKGMHSMANPYGPNPVNKKEKVTYQKGDTLKSMKVQYIGGLFKGTLSILPAPNEQQLSIFSQAVYKNTPYHKEQELHPGGQAGNPIPSTVGEASPIKHVFYIIKENRTYDQVLSDVPGGNGDTSLLLFGEQITPNQHALAKEFVLLDNFYVNGEVSADGHNWSTAAYATDYLEKTWPTAYGGRGGNYDSEGNRAVANSKNGFIWNLCQKYGVSYRTYGEFADDYKPNIPVLAGHFCNYYTSWDEEVRDTSRYAQWRQEFDSMINTSSVPQLNTLRFINDHTEGLRKGRPTPFAHVADNDLAVGLFVQHLSESPIWNESVVFILEDDAQNGPDHVDAHRSTAYVAGGLVKRHFVDHSMYSTSSMLRTMELILGLPPMSQYDAAALPMWNCFSPIADKTVFHAIAAKVNLDDKNIAYNKWQKMSDEMDFSAEDRAPDAALNQILWVAVKGEQSACPAPVHAAFLRLNTTAAKDDDD